MLNERLSLAAALSVTKFTIVITIDLVVLRSDFSVNKMVSASLTQFRQQSKYFFTAQRSSLLQHSVAWIRSESDLGVQKLALALLAPITQQKKCFLTAKTH